MDVAFLSARDWDQAFAYGGLIYAMQQRQSLYKQDAADWSVESMRHRADRHLLGCLPSDFRP